ncbi:MAG: SAM-dependent methyltransferase [Betaproteobacteria bacterium]
MKFWQKLIYRLSPKLYMAGQNVDTLLFKQGQWRSIRENRPVRADGSWVPWYTYPAVEYLVQFDWSDSAIFEYGAGASSLFWAARARSVTSVDRDADWIRRLEPQTTPNLRLLLRAARREYVNAIQESGLTFDLIVIDGHWRHDCVLASLDRLGPRGMVLLDNSDKFPLAAARLREKGLFQVDFHGFGPMNNYAWTTSLFICSNAGPTRRADPRPIAGLGVAIGPENET